MRGAAGAGCPAGLATAARPAFAPAATPPPAAAFALVIARAGGFALATRRGVGPCGRPHAITGGEGLVVVFVAGPERWLATLTGLLAAGLAITAGTTATAAATAPPAAPGSVFFVTRPIAARGLLATGCVAGRREQIGLDRLLLGQWGTPRLKRIVVPSLGPRFTFRFPAWPVIELAVARFPGDGATVLASRTAIAFAPASTASSASATPPSATPLAAFFAAVFAAIRGSGLTAIMITLHAVVGTRSPPGDLVAGVGFVVVAFHPRAAVDRLALLTGRWAGGTRGGTGRFRGGPADAEIRCEGVPVATGSGGGTRPRIRPRPRGRLRWLCGTRRRGFGGGRRAERLGERRPGIVGGVFRHDWLPGRGHMAAVGPPVQLSRKDTTIAPDSSGHGISCGAGAHGAAVSVRIRLPLSATSNSGR